MYEEAVMAALEADWEGIAARLQQALEDAAAANG